MEPSCPSFSLTQPWAEERIFLVDKLDAIRLCSQGAYEAVSAWKALWALENMFPRDPFRLRIFTGKVRLICFQQSSINDDKLMTLVKMSIQHSDLVAIKLGQPVELSGPAKRSQELRRIARSIDNKTHGRLSASGRQYQLVADEELSRMPNRDSYEVVQLVDAQKVLDALAKQPGTGPDLAELFKQACDYLTRYWERPYEADGLILMRRIFTPQAATSNNEPAITPSQLRALMEKAALEIHVVDLNKNPQEGLAFKIDMPDGGSVSGKLDKDGCGRAKSSLLGDFTVSFPDLDGADWDGDGALALPPEEERSEASTYEVKQGDRLPTIGRDKGFLRWQTIWNFKGNADLRKLRGTAHILLPGDKVSIPSKFSREAEVPGGTSEYVVQTAAEVLRVCFAVGWDWDENPVSYTAKPDSGGPDISGPLDSEGWMEIDLPPNTRQVEVVLWTEVPNIPIATYDLHVGEMDPIDEITGVQARLANLGYYDGEIDGDAQEVTAAAIAQFRREHGLPMGDQIDDDLRDALDGLHNSDEAPADTEPDQTFSADEEPEDGRDPTNDDGDESNAADQGGDEDGKDDTGDEDWIEDDEWDGDWEEEDEESNDVEDMEEDSDEENTSDVSQQE
jgi:N-acetylmuramoyl-L-alanine amidase